MNGTIEANVAAGATLKSSVPASRLAWPNQTSLPRDATRASAAVSDAPPTDSSTRSNGPSLDSTSGTTSAAPSASRRSPRSGEDETAVTSAPCAAASSTTKCPTPPEAPVSRTRRPATDPASRSSRSAVSPATPRVDAVRHVLARTPAIARVLEQEGLAAIDRVRLDRDERLVRRRLGLGSLAEDGARRRVCSGGEGGHAHAEQP